MSSQKISSGLRASIICTAIRRQDTVWPCVQGCSTHTLGEVHVEHCHITGTCTYVTKTDFGPPTAPTVHVVLRQVLPGVKYKDTVHKCWQTQLELNTFHRVILNTTTCSVDILHSLLPSHTHNYCVQCINVQIQLPPCIHETDQDTIMGTSRKY